MRLLHQIAPLSPCGEVLRVSKTKGMKGGWREITELDSCPLPLFATQQGGTGTQAKPDLGQRVCANDS